MKYTLNRVSNYAIILHRNATNFFPPSLKKALITLLLSCYTVKCHIPGWYEELFHRNIEPKSRRIIEWFGWKGKGHLAMDRDIFH